ncbi:hypothetical protein K501DRAFT_180514, partial [Backusella circina FSU 941]
SHSAHLMSEEVQFAARFVLGHIATCVISNESLAKSVLDTLLDPENSKKFRNIDTAVDLVQFAKGYAAGHFTATMASWPTKTAGLDALAKKGMYKLLEDCNKPATDISESRALGIMMGWASEINSQDMQEVYWFGKEMLTGYLEGANINKGLLFGATWVCAKGALSDSGVLDQETLQLLESVVAQATVDANLAQHYYHFAVPFAQVSHSQFVHSQEDENAPIFKSLCATHLDLIEKDNQSSHYRIASIFSLGSIFNVNYLSSIYNTEQLVMAAQKYSPIARKPVLDKLMFVAGLTGNRSPVGNLKSGRIAASVCGQVIEATLNLQSGLENEQNHLSNAEHKLMLASASSEPKTLARLNKNTSFIRAVFDRLESASQEELLVLMDSLVATPGPLPAVNWFHPMQQVSSVSESLYTKCLVFASLHASTSLSLTEFLLSQLSSSLDPQKSNHNVHSLIVGETGLGWMLDLAGLTRENAAKNTRRGMSSVTKKTSISDIRLLEMFELYVTRLPDFELEDQRTFLATLALHLPEPKAELDETKTKIVAAIRTVVLRNYIPTLFERDRKDVELIQNAVECGIVDVEQLFESESMETWFVDHLFVKTVMLSQIHRLKRANQPVKWMIDVITRLVAQREKADECWPIVAKVIGEDATVTSDKLSWVIRVLDAFIVVGTTYKEAAATIEYSIGTGLYLILSVLWWQVIPSAGEGVERAGSGYMLSHVVDIAKGTTMQQQIIKRMYKMIELSTETKSFFTSVIRQCQEKSVTNESNYIDVITS